MASTAKSLIDYLLCRVFQAAGRAKPASCNPAFMPPSQATVYMKEKGLCRSQAGETFLWPLGLEVASLFPVSLAMKLRSLMPL